MAKNSTEKTKSSVLVVVLVLIIAALCGYILLSGRAKPEAAAPAETPKVAENQGAYVKPEQPIDRSKNVTLPGWGGFTIPANSQTITQGFEFHNPEENLWYEDEISIDGTALEKLVVDSGNKTELAHYLRLAGINETVTEVTDYDADCFAVAQNDNAYTLEAIAGFDGTKTVTVKTDAGREVKLDVTCSEDYYYMTFGLFLTEGDELLYQSDLVSPGNYIQTMEMTRSLEPGEYDAYVVCQPYRSDKTTKTNQGVVKITLTAK